MKKKRIYLILSSVLLLPLTSLADTTAKTETQVVITPQQSVEKTAGLWIDVRSAEEFEQGHLDGALNIPHTELADKILSLAPDKTQPINLYCRSGRRAESALQELKALGYTNVTNYGGYEELIRKGGK